ERKASRLLIVEDDALERQTMIDLIGSSDVEITAVASVAEAMESLATQHFDCMVLDLTLQDLAAGGPLSTSAGFDLLSRMAQNPDFRSPPVIVYTGRTLSAHEETRLKRFARSIILKDARSPERLLAETTLFLHRVEAAMPQPKRRMLQGTSDTLFRGKKVLIV